LKTTKSITTKCLHGECTRREWSFEHNDTETYHWMTDAFYLIVYVPRVDELQV